MPTRDELAAAEEDHHERRILTFVVAALALLGLGALTLSIVLDPDETSVIQRSIKELSIQLWPFSLTTAAALLLYERSLRKKFVQDLINVSGPRIVEALRPVSVMETLLARVYGPNPANRDVTVSVLGGEGLRDEELSVSVDTTVTYTLGGVADGQYELNSHISYAYRGSVVSEKFIIVATCAPELRDLVVVGCEFPLFDSWYVPETELFLKSLAELRASATLSIAYLDSEDRRHETEATNAQLKEVPFRKWSEYLSFFRRDLGALKKLDPRRYKNSLKIYECDLPAHTSESIHTVQRIAGLSLSVSTLQSVSDGYCFWSAPYPCYVRTIDFKLADFAAQNWCRFRPVIFGVRAMISGDRWFSFDEISPVHINSWMLPGHGFALMWRSEPVTP